jgi:cytosine/adenosine deaminase-related metal-dependent hydrolase
MGSHTHFMETYPQYLAASARWEGGAAFELDRLGLLGGHTSLAHAIWLDGSSRTLLAERGVTAIHNPLSNQMLGSGRMPVRKMLETGVRLGLGSDCSNTSGRHDLFETMRQMLVSGREPGSWHGDWIRPEEALRAAVEDGWAALGNGPAELRAGAVADLMIVDFDSVTLAGADICAASVVSHGDPRAVRDLMVDGLWLMRDREITVFDERLVMEEAAAHGRALRVASMRERERLKSLTDDYDRWSSKTFTPLVCRHCGSPHPPADIDSCGPKADPTTSNSGAI